MGYSDAAKNLMLEELRSLTVYASLHSADPGVTGANELTGGSPAYARQSMTFAAASDGEMVSSNQPVFDVPAGFVLYVGFWTAVSSGTFLGSGALSPAPDEYTEQGLFKLTTGTFDLNSSGIQVPALVGAAVIDSITADVAGYMEPYGAGASALTAITATVEGMMVPVGTVASNLSAMTASGVANYGADVEGTVAADLGAMTADSAGLMVPLAAGAADLSAMSASVSGVRVDTGTAAADISAMTASGTGEQTSSATDVSDNFNRATEDPLGNGNWTTITSCSAMKITGGNNVVCSSTGMSGSRWSADTFAPDQYAELNMTTPPGSSDYTDGGGPAVRISSSAATYYVGLIWGYFDGEDYTYYVQLAKCVSGAVTPLGSSFNWGWGGGYEPVVKIEVSGTSLVLKTAATHGGTYTQRCSATDSAISSGSAGMAMLDHAGNPTVDDWYGGDL